MLLDERNQLDQAERVDDPVADEIVLGLDGGLPAAAREFFYDETFEFLFNSHFITSLAGRFVNPAASRSRLRQPWVSLAAEVRPVLSRARSAIYAQHDVVLLLKVLEAASPPADRRLRVERATPQHIGAMVELMRRELGWDLTKLFRERLTSGAGAILGYLDRDLIGFIWWADTEAMPRVEPLLPIQYGVRLEAGDAYLFDLFVSPVHRGGGTASSFLAAAESELKRLGFDRMQGYALTHNRPARWLFLVTGHQTGPRLKSKVLLRRLLQVDGSLYLATSGGFRRCWRYRRH